MWKKGDGQAREHGGAMPPGAFFGLGLPMDAALFKAARMSRRAARPWTDAPARPAPEPARPWGFDLLVTFSRLTRAG